MDTNEAVEIARQYRSKILAKLVAEQAVNLSDSEIERVFRPVVAPHFCIFVAKTLRDAGLLKTTDLQFVYLSEIAAAKEQSR